MSSGFYTSIERFGNDILWRGYENGKPFMRREKFKPKLFLANHSGQGKYISLGSKKPLVEKTFQNMKDCREFLDQYKDVHGMEIFGNTNYVAQFAYEKYPNHIDFDMNKIHIFMFDIEVDISTAKPNMQTADRMITSIAIKSSKRDEYILLGLKDYDRTKTETGIPVEKIRFMKFDSEVKMLAYFVKLWCHDYPEIMEYITS